MSYITAPPTPSPPFYIGKGLRGANGKEIMILGQPIPNDGVLGTGSLTYPSSILSPTTLFDLSGIGENHEVVVCLYTSPNNIYSKTTYNWTWYRARDNKVVFAENSWILPDPPSDQHYSPGSSAFQWIGWLSDTGNGVGTYPKYVEIQENGNYYVIVSASGGENFTSSPINFAVTGIPPSLVLSNPSTNSFSWLARLSNYFDTSNYIRVGICKQPFTDGQSSPPNEILDYAYPPSSNLGCAASGTATGLTSSTNYTVYGFAQAANGLYYKVGTSSITTPGIGRPPNWEWATPKVAGQDFKLTATEWNQFCERINQFREYIGLNTKISFTPAPYGDGSVYAFMFNQALVGIAGGTFDGSSFYYQYLLGMNYTIRSRLPTNRKTGDSILAAYLNDMRDGMNSVP